MKVDLYQRRWRVIGQSPENGLADAIVLQIVPCQAAALLRDRGNALVGPGLILVDGQTQDGSCQALQRAGYALTNNYCTPTRWRIR